ncbi:uncharacterized protein N7482_005219 [Penicillium canariense]|uniref:Uncharacterized protein n=1 Tax=Penicillium canariense TaxID=189055 RepID=A0A9W9I4D5_9EURO|nr:uncharacterized protein N7482_005219 [Penicillium canariense]KAJ5166438.1 hypothetical protein N7482_005219 [Penicillium canariense]
MESPVRVGVTSAKSSIGCLHSALRDTRGRTHDLDDDWISGNQVPNLAVLAGAFGWEAIQHGNLVAVFRASRLGGRNVGNAGFPGLTHAEGVIRWQLSLVGGGLAKRI